MEKTASTQGLEPEGISGGLSPAEVAAMRDELDQWKNDLKRMSKEGATSSMEELMEQMERRELELQELEEKQQQLEEAANNYAVPEYREKAGRSGPSVAVAGRTGVGKSLLVNTLRGVGHRDATYAPVGIKQTTTEPRVYAFPGDSTVQLWDLPGAGSLAFPLDGYIPQVGLRHFDVVLLLVSSRFTVVEEALLQELRKHEVPHLVVRTMVDIDIKSNLVDLQQNEATTLESITEDLKEKGVQSPYLVNPRRPDTYDFKQLFADLTEAIANSRASAQPAEPLRFEAGDAAEVVVLAGPQAGSWARCVITGDAAEQDTYAILLPDAPAEKRRVPNVHVSALRRGKPEPPIRWLVPPVQKQSPKPQEQQQQPEKPQEPQKPQQPKQPQQQPPEPPAKAAPEAPPPASPREPPPRAEVLDLEMVVSILKAFKAVASQHDVQSALAGVRKQGPDSPGVQRMRQSFISEIFRPSLASIDLPVEREVSPELMRYIREHQEEGAVCDLAHEVEGLLGLPTGELFGIPVKVSFWRPSTLSASDVSVRDMYKHARKHAESQWLLWFLCAYGFVELLSFGAIPGPFLNPMLLVFRTYAYHRRTLRSGARWWNRLVLPVCYASGAAAACLAVCLAARAYGQDFMAWMPSSMAQPDGTLRRGIENFGALGVFLYILLVGSCLAMPPVLCASLLGCSTVLLTLAVLVASIVKYVVDLELLLVLRSKVLLISPFAKAPESAQPEEGLLKSWVAAKQKVEMLARDNRDLATCIIFGLNIFNMVTVIGNYFTRHFAGPLKYCLYYIDTVEDDSKGLLSLVRVPAVEGVSVALAAALIQVAARLLGHDVISHLAPETGWEWARAAVTNYGSLGAGLCVFVYGSPAIDPLLAAFAGILGCNVMGVSLALFFGTFLRTLISLESCLAAIRGYEELVPVEKGD